MLAQQFELLLNAHNLFLKESLVVGQLTRCDVGQHPSGKNDGAYIYFQARGKAWGGWQNHQDGQGWQKWSSQHERQVRTVNPDTMLAEILAKEAADIARKEKAAWRAKKIWEAGAPAMEHPYLIAKQVAAVAGMRVGDWTKGDKKWEQALLIPLIDGDCFTSLQAIYADGSKDLLWGGQKQGSFFPLKPLQTGCSIVLCEGYATAWSASQQFKRVGVMAVDAGNLCAVAIRLKHLYQADILVGADNDPAGIAGAQACQRAIGCDWTAPEGQGADWNDVFNFNQEMKNE